MPDPSQSPAGPVQRATRTEKARPLKWYHHLAAFVIVALARLLSWTWRVRFDEDARWLAQGPGPVIFSCWHNRLALSMLIWEQAGRPRCQAEGLVALISASHDGGLLARVLKFFGVQAVRGSSSRRGPQALLELTTWTEKGYAVAITPDGPRGPCYEVREGIVSLAQVSGLPIVPVTSSIRWKICLRSWDKFQIPLPFSRCEVRFGQPIQVPRQATDEGRAAIRLHLQNVMRENTRD